jgi:two-component system sensor histidine kinase VicK
VGLISKINFYSVFDNFTSGVVIHDSNSMIVYSNRAALLCLGLSLDEMMGKEITDPRWHFIREDGSRMPIEEFPFNVILSSQKVLKELIIGIVKPDQDYPTWGLCSGHPEFDVNGNVSQVIINLIDITELKNVEKKLHSSLDFTNNMIQSMQDGFVVLNENAVHIDINPSFCKLVNWSYEELIGLTAPFPYWPPEEYEHIQSAFQETLEGKNSSYELIFMRKSGERFPVIVSPSILKDGNQKIIGYLAVIRDITERNRAKDELEAALESAKEAAIVKSRFLDIAAHELRTPITSFSLLLQLTKQKLKKSIPVSESTLQRLQSQVERISKLVIELLDVSRLERGVMTLKPSLTDMVSLIAQSIDDFKLNHPARSINFIIPNTEIEIMCDNLRIFQVVSNLIDNAIKYTPDNSPIEVSIEKTRNGGALVSVKDSGQGISKKDQETLFSPFVRGAPNQAAHSPGLGLGLFIAREIIALHGGTLGVRSEIGIGSTFYFELN